MEKKWNNNKTLPYKHIREPAKEILGYIDDRRMGTIKSLKTKWPKFNNACMGGIESNVVITIAGISGSGKSSFVNNLETDLFDNNPNDSFIVLSFSFEMLSARQVGRKLSQRMRRTTSELYSSVEGEESITDLDYEMIKKHTARISKYPIYYVDRPGSIEEIDNTIGLFQNFAKQDDKKLIVILDHTLLVKGMDGQKERETLYELQKVFIERKKVSKTTIIQISQMNRNIETTERINNPMLHYPMRSDLSGSDSLFQASDYVIVLHRPEILGITEYGKFKKPVKDVVFLHFLKVREGEPKILRFKNNLKHNTLEELNTPE